mgnify:CR=1 FL=1
MAVQNDVVIVGGGIAGLMTALQLVDDAKKEGLKIPAITILEADKEFGGRVKDTTLSNGVKINGGANWFHGGDNNHFFQFSQARYGDALGPVLHDNAEDAGKRTWVFGEGIYNADLKTIAMKDLNTMFEKWDAENPGKDISLGELARRCTTELGRPQAEAYAKYMATAWMAVDNPDQVSYHEYNNDPNGAGGKMLKNGLGRVIDAMVAELKENGVNLQTNTPIAAIRNTATGTELTDMSGNTITAAKTVVTASVGVLKSGIIDFDQQVKDRLDPYLAGITMANMTKIVIPVDDKFFADKNIKPDTFMSVLDRDPMFMCHANTGGKPTLTLFLGGEAATRYENMHTRELDLHTRNYLDRIPELKGYSGYLNGWPHVTPWANNQFTQGAYSAALPGTKRSDPITVGNVTIGGEAFVADPNKSPSMMMGAWHSGKMMAGQLLNDLKLTLQPVLNEPSPALAPTLGNNSMSMSPKEIKSGTAYLDYMGQRVPRSVAGAVSFQQEQEDDSGQKVMVEIKPGQMLNNAMEGLTQSRKDSRAKREEVLSEGYTVATYKLALLQGVEIVDNDSPKSQATLQKVIDDILTPLIPIEDEREDLAGLRKIMQMNSGTDAETKAIRDTVGNFKEIWIVLRDPKTGDVIGAANSAIYSAKGTEAGQHVDATVNNVYLLVDEKYRGLGVSQLLMDLRKDAVREFLQKEYPEKTPEQHRYVMFNEQNDPLRMTMQEILFDTAAGDSATEKKGSKMCQFLRQTLFTKAFNNRTLAFNYVQPALGDNEPCATLYYNAFAHGPVDFKDGLPSSVVKQNLKSFFTHSVAKDPAVLETDIWKDQQKELDSQKTIKWADPIDYREFGKQVYGMISKTIMGVLNADKDLGEVFGQKQLGELGVVPPLLDKSVANEISATAAARQNNNPAINNVVSEVLSKIKRVEQPARP